MAKIRVEIVFLEEGVFLFHPKTKLVFEYLAPHRVIGKIDLDDFRLVRKGVM